MKILLFFISVAFIFTSSFAFSENMSESDALKLVRNLPNSLSKTVGLKIISSKTTKFRIDQHGLPAWTWRDSNGDAGYGGCIHIHPKTGEPYLETQYPKDKKFAAAKYIDFGANDKDWHCRYHWLRPVEGEINWTNKQCHQNALTLAKTLNVLIE